MFLRLRCEETQSTEGRNEGPCDDIKRKHRQPRLAPIFASSPPSAKRTGLTSGGVGHVGFQSNPRRPFPNCRSACSFSAAGSIRFTLDGVPEPERLPVFREVFGRKVLKYDLEPLPDIPFDVDVKFQALPGLMMMSGRVHGSRNQRTRETLAADPTDDVGMIVNLRGPHRIVHGGREIVLGDGEATLVSLGEVCSFTHRPPGDILALARPAQAVRSAGDRAWTIATCAGYRAARRR